MSKLNTIACLVISAFVVSACGERPPEKKASQVVAKVNSGEISVHQINFLLQRTPNVPADKADAVKRQLLEGLIDQELSVQQAMDAKLDRTPGVVEAIENAKREILSRAYLEQVVSKAAKPSDADISKFYGEHPELFSNRKIYRMEEIVFVSTPELVAGVKEQLGAGKPASEVVAGLRSKGVEIGGGAVVKAAEQLALEILPRLAAAKEGQPMLLETPGKAAIITVLATKSEPLSEAKAKPFIENFLLNKQKGEMAREAIKQLREKAKIEYMGEFAGAKPAAAAAPAPEKKAESGDSVVNKGVAGLK